MTLRLLHCLSIGLLIASPALGAKSHTPVAAAADEPGRYGTASTEIEDYQLGVGDKIRLTVFNEPTLSGEFGVGANGSISLPLVGDVPATGKTAPQIATQVQAALANGYLKQPQVSAEVITFRPFFILGEVKAPGQYPYASGLTVFNAIATAQGFTPRAERKHVFIRRAGTQDERSYRLTPDLRVLPGDTLRLGERYF